jgi:hypothetical protein
MGARVERQPLPQRPRYLNVVTEAIDDQGRYDAVKIAELLDWTRQEIAQYLGKDPSAISRNSASLQYQQPLSELAAAFSQLLELMNCDLKTARAWLRTPLKVLDGKSPKEKILRHDLKAVDALLSEVPSGFSV